MARPSLKEFRRIVVKVGSSLLIDSDAGEVRASWLGALAADLAKLHGEGREPRRSHFAGVGIDQQRRADLDDDATEIFEVWAGHEYSRMMQFA